MRTDMEDHLRLFATNLQKYRAAEKALEEHRNGMQDARAVLEKNLAAFANDISNNMPADMFEIFMREVCNEAVMQNIPLPQVVRSDG
jgi:hypothetical protein